MKQFTRKARSAALILTAVACTATAQTVEFFDNELGISGGSTLSQSFTKNGLTMTVSTADGLLAYRPAPDPFVGLWISRWDIENGTYTIDFGGLAMTVLEFEFDAFTGGPGTGPAIPPEVLDQFAVIGATPSVAVSDIVGVNVVGGTIADLVLTATVPDGQATIRFESAIGFTSLSFRHTQDLSMNGFVIERVFAEVIPTPASAALLGFAGLAAARRRR